MLTLNDGRSELWQWDTGRKLTVDADCTQVHFSNKFFGRSVDVDVFDGTAEIPDVLLQADKELLVWAFVGTAENGYTKISKVFKVNKRNKPADYVFTPPEQTTLGELIERLDKIEESQDPDAIKNAVEDYIANNPIGIDETDPTVPEWAKHPTKPSYTASEVGALPADTVIPTIPDNVSAFRNDAGYLTEHQDLTGYATEQYVQGYAQPKGDYLTAIPDGYAKTEDIPTKPEDIGAQPAGSYLTEVPDAYATKEFVTNKIAEAELGGEEVDLSGYAKKSELPTKTSQLENDSGYLNAVPEGYAKTEDIPTKPEDIGAQPVGDYAIDYEIRLELEAINRRLTAFFDSDDQTLDELSEIVAYITSNKSLIDAITTSKVSVADIVNNLTTNVTNKPLSAAQGVVLKELIDGLSTGKLDASALQSAVDAALAQAKASGEFNGKDGKNGTSATHSWNGTVLTITSASGTSSANLKGDKGEPGEKGAAGAAGKDGTSVTVKSVSESTADGGSNVVTFSDGKTLTVKNGSKGSTGASGSNGKDSLPLFYISPSGSDSNDGLTASTPKKTVKECISAGAKRISAKRGIYAEQVALSDIDYLEIFPTDNDQEYSTSEDWHPIVFDLSDTITVGSLADYNSIKRVAYSNSANEQFDKVFTKQSQPPVTDTYGSRYNAAVWLMSNDEKTVCIKLKPVLTVAECEAESNTFTWVSNYIYINADLAGVEKVCVPTNFDSGFRIADAGKVVLREVEVRFSGSYNVWLLNCPYFDFYKVSARYSSYASGIDIDNANGTLTACYATKNFDGFGISGYGHTTYIDCVSEFNFDDGVSHHNGSCGTFIGGRYEGNGKGGNTPAYGAQVNIYGGIYKDNAQFGIGYLYTSGKNPAGGVVQGAVMAGNPVGLNVDKNCAVTAINCLYKDNTVDKSIKGTLTEYNPPVSGGSDESGETGPVNLLPLAINSDGTLYVGTNGEKGYKTGYRLNSSGLEKEQTGCMITGFIPAKAGDIVRIENFTPNTAGYGYMHIYKSDFTKYGTPMQGGAMASGMVDGVLTVDISEQFTGDAADFCAYFRISVTEITDNTIITVTPKA